MVVIPTTKVPLAQAYIWIMQEKIQHCKFQTGHQALIACSAKAAKSFLKQKALCNQDPRCLWLTKHWKQFKLANLASINQKHRIFEPRRRTTLLNFRVTFKKCGGKLSHMQNPFEKVSRMIWISCSVIRRSWRVGVAHALHISKCNFNCIPTKKSSRQSGGLIF